MNMRTPSQSQPQPTLAETIQALAQVLARITGTCVENANGSVEVVIRGREGLQRWLRDHGIVNGPGNESSNFAHLAVELLCELVACRMCGVNLIFQVTDAPTPESAVGRPLGHISVAVVDTPPGHERNPV